MDTLVELVKPRVAIRKFNETGEQFRPMVTSPYTLTLSEGSELLPHEGEGVHFTRLLNLPTKPIVGYVALRDIHNEGANMKGIYITKPI